jgi:hypothetical protein
MKRFSCFALSIAMIGASSNALQGEVIHQWDFEETAGSGPLDTDDAVDGFSLNLALTNTTQVAVAGTGAPASLGAQALKTGDGLTTTGNNKASVFDSTGVAALGWKGLNGGTASMWIYRTGENGSTNGANTIFTIERDGSGGAGTRASIQVFVNDSDTSLPLSNRAVGGLSIAGREAAGNSTRATYNTNAAQGNFLPLNTWVHIVGVWDYINGDPDNDTLQSGMMKLYANGVPIIGGDFGNSWAEDPANVALNANNANGIAFGSGNAVLATSNQEEFEGMIDAVRLYNTALSDDDVARLYQSYVPEPSSAALAAMVLGVIATRRRRA